MVRKVISCALIGVLVAVTMVVTLRAAELEAYDGNISTSYLTYFKDIDIPFNYHYVFVRTNQYNYELLVGQLTYTGSGFVSSDPVLYYRLSTGSGVNSYNTWVHGVYDSLDLSVSDQIVFSDLGDYPQLHERGSKHEMLQTILIVIIGLCSFIRPLLYPRFSR